MSSVLAAGSRMSCQCVTMAFFNRRQLTLQSKQRRLQPTDWSNGLVSSSSSSQLLGRMPTGCSVPQSYPRWSTGTVSTVGCTVSWSADHNNSLSLSILTADGLAGSWSPFWILLELRTMEVVVTSYVNNTKFLRPRPPEVN